MPVSSGADDLIARPFFLSNLSRTVNRVQGNVSESEINGSTLKGMRFLCAEDNELNAEILVITQDNITLRSFFIRR